MACFKKPVVWLKTYQLRHARLTWGWIAAEDSSADLTVDTRFVECCWFETFEWFFPSFFLHFGFVASWFIFKGRRVVLPLFPYTFPGIPGKSRCLKSERLGSTKSIFVSFRRLHTVNNGAHRIKFKIGTSECERKEREPFGVLKFMGINDECEWYSSFNIYGKSAH